MALHGLYETSEGGGPSRPKRFLETLPNKFHLDLSALKFLQGLRVPVRYLVASNFHSAPAWP